MSEARVGYVRDDITHGSFGRILRAKVWWLLLITVVVFLTSAAAYPFIPRSYEAAAWVYIQPTDQNGIPGPHSTLDAFDESQIQAYTDILGAHPMMLAVINEHHLLQDAEFNPILQNSWRSRLRSWLQSESEPLIDPEQAVEAVVRKHLVIKRDRKSYMMQVGFWGANPNLAAGMSNTLAQAFVADRLSNRQHFHSYLVATLQHRATQLLSKYLDSEGRTHAFLVESGLLHTDQQASAEHQLVTLSTEYAMAISHAAAAEERAQSLVEMQRLNTLDSAPDVLASPIIRDLKERMITLSAGVGAVGTIGRGGASGESLADLRGLINTEAQRIVRSAQAEATMSHRHVTTLLVEIAHIDAKTVAWREAERKLSVLKRESEADLKTLQDTMNQWRSQEGLISVLQPDVQVYTTAVTPARPAFPNLTLYTIGTLILAILLAGLIVMPAISAEPDRHERHVREA